MTSAERAALHGSNIRAERRRVGMRQSELALLVGSSQTRVSFYENGHAEVPKRLRKVIAGVFGVSEKHLFPPVRVRELARAA